MSTLLSQLVWSTAAFLVGIGLIALVEFGITGRRAARTFGYNVAYGLLMTVLAVALQPVAVAESAYFVQVLGVPPVPLPTHGWSVLFSAFALMLAADLIFYWVHRAQHRFEPLWRMHSFHHSDNDLNAAASYRHFWIEKPIWILILYAPLGLIFRISPQAAAAYSLLFTFFAYFPHLGLRLELGPLTKIILGPQVHRLHHSVERRHFNTNFCGAFPVWDLLFGTYVAPQTGEFPSTGLPSVEATPGAVQTLLWPAYLPTEDAHTENAAAGL